MPLAGDVAAQVGVLADDKISAEREENDRMAPEVDRNSTVPTDRKRIFSTAEDNQMALTVPRPRRTAGPAVMRPMTARKTPSMPSLRSDEGRGRAVSVNRREKIELEGLGERGTPR